MPKGCISWVAACKDFFGDVTIPEFKSLSPEDKRDLHGMLEAEGYELHPLLDKPEVLAQSA